MMTLNINDIKLNTNLKNWRMSLAITCRNLSASITNKQEALEAYTGLPV